MPNLSNSKRKTFDVLTARLNKCSIFCEFPIVGRVLLHFWIFDWFSNLNFEKSSFFLLRKVNKTIHPIMVRWRQGQWSVEKRRKNLEILGLFWKYICILQKWDQLHVTKIILWQKSKHCNNKGKTAVSNGSAVSALGLQNPRFFFA